MPVSDSLEVIVVGGGIGGLIAANALLGVGCRVRVYERQPGVREVGAGLAITPNGMVPLGSLGLRTPVEQAGTIIKDTAIVTSAGRRLSHFPMADVAERLGSSSVTLHRAALLGAFHDGFGAGPIEVGKRFVRYEQNASQVTAHFEDGSSATGDLLVGADGVHSSVRTQMLGERPTRDSGYVCYRGVTEEPFEHSELRRGRLIEIWGRGTRMGASHIAEGRVHWWFAENLPPGALPPQSSWKERLLQLTADWAPPGPQILMATDSSAFLCNRIQDRLPDARWTEGRATLLGDAAHPMAPDLGQGANQAIEDAFSLAASLKRASSVPEALDRYERLRRPRTAKIQQMSWQFGQMGQWTSPLATSLRAASMWMMPHWLWVRQFETLMRAEL